MKCKSLVLLLLLPLSITVFSQEKYDFPTIDKITYQQYLDKDWENLIHTSNKALKNGVDFYYLQVRTGIAYYETKHYALAVKYFENAYSQNNDDELIQEYLFFSYLYSGRFDDARYFGSKLNQVLKDKLLIQTEYPLVRAIYLDTKHDINKDYTYVPTGNELVYQKNVKNQSYYNFSLEHWIGKRFTIFHGYSNIGITNEVFEVDINIPPIYKEFVYQHEYYISLKSYIAKGTSVTGGVHYLYTNYLAPDPNSRMSGNERWGTKSSSLLYDTTENAFAVSLNITKQFSIVNVSFGISMANLNNSLQLQPELSLKVYPLGNPVFFVTCKADYLIEKSNSVFKYYPILKPGIGIGFLKYSWFEPSISFGNLHNYTEYNAFIANNDIDHVFTKYEGLLNIGLFKGKFNLFFKYQYNIKNNTFYINGIENTIPYINHSITGGLKWYFNKK
jgi:hypothetical protein